MRLRLALDAARAAAAAAAAALADRLRGRDPAARAHQRGPGEAERLADMIIDGHRRGRIP